MKRPLFNIITLFLLFFIAPTNFASIIVKVQGKFPVKIQDNVNLTVNEINSDIKNQLNILLKNKINTSKHQIIDEIIHQTFSKTPKKLREAIAPFGYFNPSIKSWEEHKADNDYIWFHIDLGTPIRIKSFKLTITGQDKDRSDLLELKNTPSLQPGHILNTDEYKNLINNLLMVAVEHGDFSRKITHKSITINDAKRTADINITFDTGRQFTIGETHFSKTNFNTTFLKRFLTYKKGDPYELEAMKKTEHNFSNSPYFNSAIVIPNIKNSKNHAAAINISLSQTPKHIYSFGIGFNSETEWRLLAEYTNNLVNKNGHLFNTSIQLSKTEKNIFLQYSIPGKNPGTTVNNISAGYSDMKQPNGTSHASKIILSHKKKGEHSTLSYSLNALNEQYNINQYPKTTANMLYPSVTWSYNSTGDENQIPSTGYYLNINLAGTVPKLSKQSGFAQLSVEAKYLKTLANGKTRLLLRATAARTFIKNILNLPLSMQLYAGGPGSIRGYHFHDLPNGDPGRNLITGSIELQQQIHGPLYLTAFCDAGNVTNNKNPFKKLKVGAGFGVAAVTTLGTFELSVATPINQANKKWLIQFSMDPIL
jgi:translocation and assembly module TamA